MNFKEHLSDEAGLSGLLNYAHLVADGIIINKDGAFLCAYKFLGPDTSAFLGNDLDNLTSVINNAMNLLDDGWMVHVDEIRRSISEYPKQNYFPNKVAKLIDLDRQSLYENEQKAQKHFENEQIITFVWKFPLIIVKNNSHLFLENANKTTTKSLENLLSFFQDKLEKVLAILSISLKLTKLNSPQLLEFLNLTISGTSTKITLTGAEEFIDVVLGRHEIIGGCEPKIDQKRITVISILGYINSETVPGILDEICSYPLTYRFSNRFIPLSEATANSELKKYQKNWHNKVKGFLGTVKEVFSGKPSFKIDNNALAMENSVTEAMTLNRAKTTKFGYLTSCIVIYSDEGSSEILAESIKNISKYIEQSGFSCLNETMNTLEAWLGSIPGHGAANIRRIFVNSFNLGHILPFHSIWSGNFYADKNSLLPKNAPPVFYAKTIGKTPFRFHLDVTDVGHQIILGPTGAGKSTFLDFLIAQFLRYQNAQIYIFDKDYSHKALTLALSGQYYDIGENSTLSFCPFTDLQTETQKMRAEQFIENLVFLQNIKISPNIRLAIHDAILAIANFSPNTGINISLIANEIQNKDVRDALRFYTQNGHIKILDSTTDSIQKNPVQTFEMGWLLNQKEEIYLPILLHIFDQIETKLDKDNATCPTLIILEEAWNYIGHEFFAKKLRDWLKTLRKKNARVIFATQSLADLYDPETQNLTKITAAIMESCPTKIFLPNSKMDEEIKDLYRKIGLSDRQIEIIKEQGIPKKNYYVVTPNGNRLIDLGLDDLCLSFLGLSKEKSAKLINCIEKNPENWLPHWLRINNLENNCYDEKSL